MKSSQSGFQPVVKFSQHVRQAVLLPFLAILILTGVLLVEVNDLIVSERRIDNEDQLISQARLVERYLVDAETSLRGYLLSHNLEFLEPYEHSRDTLPGAFEVFKSMAQKDPVALAQIKAIEKASFQWLSKASNLIPSANANRELLVNYSFKEKSGMDEIRNAFSQFVGQEVNDRASEITHGQGKTHINFVIIGTFVVLMSLFFGFFTRKALSSLDYTYQQSLERFNLAQWAAHIGSFEWDLKSSMLFWTKELEALHGLKPGAFDGEYATWMSFIHPEDLSRVHVDLATTLKTKRDLNTGFRIVQPSGNVRWFQVRAKVLDDKSGYPDRMIGIIIDATEKHKVDEQLRALAMDLQKAVDVRDEFLSIASHELKTPLTSLKLQVQILERILKNKKVVSIDQLQKAIDVSNSQVNRVSELIDNLLDLTKLKGGRENLHFEKVDIVRLIHNQIERVAEQWSESTSLITFKNSAPLIIECDRFRMEQVVINLLTNAMKYGNGNPVDVSVSEEAQWISLKVSDYGLGIEKAKQASIFDRYVRAVSHKNIGGLGLGLFIVKQNVMAHRGTVDVTSELGVGSTFVVRIPKFIGTQVVGARLGSEKDQVGTPQKPSGKTPDTQISAPQSH